LRSSKVYHTSFFDPDKKKKKEKKNLETCAIPGMSHVSKSPTKATRKFEGGGGGGEEETFTKILKVHFGCSSKIGWGLGWVIATKVR